MIRDILLQCDAGSSNPGRVDTAISFASKFGAHLQAVYVMPSPAIPSYAEGYSAVIPYSAEEQIKLVQQQMEEAKGQFSDKSKNADVITDWRSIEFGSYDVVLDLSRYCDIVIVPQYCARFGDEDKIFIADDLLIHSGRPLVVVPDLNKSFELGEKVMIAWDESHEAARAIHDGLAILSKANQIHAVTVAEMPDSEERFLISGQDLQTHLQHHGLDIETTLLDKGGDEVGEKLLEKALELDADLIIMGGYGHSRLRQTILGGVTDYVFRNTTIPVLMSH